MTAVNLLKYASTMSDAEEVIDNGPTIFVETFDDVFGNMLQIIFENSFWRIVSPSTSAVSPDTDSSVHHEQTLIVNAPERLSITISKQ